METVPRVPLVSEGRAGKPVWDGVLHPGSPRPSPKGADNQGGVPDSDPARLISKERQMKTRTSRPMLQVPDDGKKRTFIAINVDTGERCYCAEPGPLLSYILRWSYEGHQVKFGPIEAFPTEAFS